MDTSQDVRFAPEIALISQSVEEMVSNTIKCGFESHSGHNTPEPPQAGGFFHFGHTNPL